jgi:predicted MPP superfamily phosphohydrolase
MKTKIDSQDQSTFGEQTNFKRGIRFLHLSDLHVGMTNQGWLWPAFKTAFLDDIRNMCRKFGGWDVVIFSGDLVQKGSQSEYEKLTEILKEIWVVFEELGFTPLLFPVPGNHDLTRPTSLNAAAKVLDQWWSLPEIQKAFWESDGGEYQNLVTSSFSNYSIWISNIKSEGIPLPDFQSGCVAGDISAIVTVRGLRIGLIGLNSAWLQLSDNDYNGKLHVDTRQLLAVTNKEPDIWCEKNNFNLLVTHHPSDWLAVESQKHWKSEIFTHIRFDCHLHGHMHEPSTTTLAEGGFSGRRIKQGASLFGLETTKQNTMQRIHGYSVCQLFEEESVRTMRHWPRKASKVKDGTHKLIPDYDFNICDEGYFEESYNLHTKLLSQPLIRHQEISLNDRIANSIETLSILRFNLPVSQAHVDVRRVEQDISIAALNQDHALWLVADWGLGSEQFIHVIKDRLAIEKGQIYKLDCQHFFSRDEIFAGVQDLLGCSFEKFCGLIASQPPCILLLDDVPIGEGKDRDIKRLQLDIEQISDILLQYCVDMKLIVKSRLAPINCSYQTVELRPFDEADTSIYIVAHDNGGKSTFSSQQIGQLFRHTDGVPARIDSVLRDIQFVGASELHRLNTDIAGKTASAVALAPGLAEAINEMQASNDPAVKQAFELLKVLTIFPRGELLSTIKRFNHTKPFYIQDARSLMELALIDMVEVPNVHPAAISADGARAMLVRRPVREYLYSVLSEQERKRLNNQALSLYFGSTWALNGIKSPRSHRFDDRKCGAWQIGNANMMVLRTAREAVDVGTKTSLKKAVELANAYCAAINKGDHYIGVVALCSDIVPLFESIENSSIDLTLLLSYYGSSLRMTGDHDKARSVLQAINITSASKALRQSILLDIALVCESLEDIDALVDAATELVKINPKSNHALQAQALLAEINDSDLNRNTKLLAIEAKAVKQNAFIVKHNLAIDRAESCTNTSERISILKEVSASAKRRGDHYNGMRATLKLAKLTLDSGEGLDSNQLSGAIESYHYLYNDCVGSLLNGCHDVLWRAFLFSNQIDNLLRLFRHSSLIWRLRGREKTELKYVKLLNDRLNLGATVKSNLPQRELNYFLTRASNMIKTTTIPE